VTILPSLALSSRQAQRGMSWRRLGIVVCLAMGLALVIGFGTLLRGGEMGPRQTDFVSYYSASHLVLEGRLDAVYRSRPLGTFERHLVQPLTVRNSVPQTNRMRSTRCTPRAVRSVPPARTGSSRHPWSAGR